MNTKNSLLTLTILGALNLACLAQDPAPGAGTRGHRPPPDGGPAAPGGPSRPHRPAPPLMAQIDTNHDGIIDATELANASVALKALDTNGDGKLTFDELRPKHRGPGPHGPSADNQPPPPKDSPDRPQRFRPPLIAALDSNNDGVIDAQEIANAASALRALDKNGDGQLTQDELRPAGGPRRGPGGRSGGPRGHEAPEVPDTK